MKSVRMAGVAVAAVSVAGVVGLGGVAEAHGTGVVSGSSVFAVCKPTVPPAPCTPGKSVTYNFSNFGTATTLNVFWLVGPEATNPQRFDCTKATDGTAGRVSMGTVSLSGGKGSATYLMPPSERWLYGLNWVCATTATGPAQIGTVGDQNFTIYPA